MRRNLPGYHLPYSSIAADVHSADALMAFSTSHTAGLWIMTAVGMAVAAVVAMAEGKRKRRRNKSFEI